MPYGIEGVGNKCVSLPEDVKGIPQTNDADYNQVKDNEA
jgi:hypothetical protein